jgi:hypothetical protein
MFSDFIQFCNNKNKYTTGNQIIFVGQKPMDLYRALMNLAYQVTDELTDDEFN